VRALFFLLPIAFSLVPDGAGAQEMRPGRYRMTAALQGGPHSIAPTCCR